MATRSCSRSRSLFRMLLISLAALLFTSGHASAWIMHWNMDDDDGTTHVIVEEDNGEWWYYRYDPDGNMEYAEEILEVDSNPNPEDPNGGGVGGTSAEALRDLARRLGGEGIQGPEWSQTPLGQILGNKGIGVGPVHNPSDEGGNGGQSPGSGSFRDPRDVAADLWFGAGMEGGGIDPNGGSIGEQLKNLARKGGSGDDDDDDGSSTGGSPWGEDMPGPPELVNPATAGAAVRLILLGAAP